MSFTKEARRVRNFRLPLPLRRAALARCITHLALYSGMGSINLVRKGAFDQKRIRQKMRGIRQPRRADLDLLYNRTS